MYLYRVVCIINSFVLLFVNYLLFRLYYAPFHLPFHFWEFIVALLTTVPSTHDCTYLFYLSYCDAFWQQVLMLFVWTFTLKSYHLIELFVWSILIRTYLYFPILSVYFCHLLLYVLLPCLLSCVCYHYCPVATTNVYLLFLLLALLLPTTFDELNTFIACIMYLFEF